MTAFEPDDLIDALIARRALRARAARPRSASSARRAGSTSSASTPTTTRASCCRPRSTSRSGSPTCPTDDRRVELTRLDDGERDGFDLDDAAPAARPWLDYVAGTAWALAEAGLPLTGLRGVDRLDPAAERRPVVVGGDRARVGLGDARRRAPPTVDPFALARICQRAENGYVGVQSGLMDQFAEACGVAGSALLLDCRSLEWRPVPLPPDLVLVVCHTGSPRHLDGSEYNLRRSQCEAAVAALARDRPGHPQPARRDARAARGGPRPRWTRSPSGAPSTS